MEPAAVLGAVTLLVAPVVLGAHPAGAEKLSGVFLEMEKAECQFLNGSERVRFVDSYIHNREQYVHFDSDLGIFVADTPLGERQAQHLNSLPEFLEQKRAEVDTFCRSNYKAVTSFAVERRVQPRVQIHLVQSSSLPQSPRLVCAVMDFYPAEVEVKWFRNGQEETESLVSTEVLPNGDWTYQVLVLLESSPQPGDTYLCQVEHSSLQHPISQRWELPAEPGRSKMLTGVGGLVLGLLCLGLGLCLHLRSKGS
ncbi:class II histocompatibility antigen, B-L beta chain-like [Melanerpes formicivorus]|uniref:class II histocompatibility antigen, B-L beta chain-like n=1 Tax=Melanerpes formicivorus TaxID=211600 RepID=UPI00358F4EFD